MSIRMTYPMMYRGEIEVDGQRIRLSPQLARMATLLVLRPDWVEHSEIVERIWPDPDTQPLATEKSITVYTYFLRKLGVPIETDWNHRLRIRREHHTTALFAPGKKMIAA